MKQRVITPAASLFDVIVAGATPSGIAAAIAAARYGLRVALVDPLPGPGQMLSNGLCVFDTGSPAGVVGIMKEFAGRIAAYHREHYGEQDCVRENRGAPQHGSADGLSFEPKVAELILNQMIAETPGLSYFPRHQLIGAIMDGKRCVGIQCRKIEGEGFDPRWAICCHGSNTSAIVEFKGRTVIDATYEGVPFERRQKVWCDDGLGHRVYARPEVEITWKEAHTMVETLIRALSLGGFSGVIPQAMALESEGNASRYFTRADGTKLLDRLTRQEIWELSLQTRDAENSSTISHGVSAARTKMANGLNAEPAKSGSNGHM